MFNGNIYSVKDLVEYVFKKLELSIEDHPIIDEKYFRPEELKDLKGDCSKLKLKTGWNPKYSFESMLDEMIDYKQQKL